ncbi:Similar to Carboxypeptidase B (Astacus astacus) [Cotesia congregata]|uniref:Similar to Carboxypeptidase B (Astacus astacus) n=1 Tax=Cotesia congregata TaxID=51543 RepID=A0A8J2HHY9_COTCN|nr:Similar to Carboxypeptidase B (Astacus astacus) [Cotesia congregata]
MKFVCLCIVIIYSVQSSFTLPQKFKRDANITGLRELDAVPIEASSEVVDTIIVKAVEIPEERVTYEGSQLWRVLADNEQSDFVSYLQDTGEVTKWTGNDSTVDVLVRPDMIPRVSRFLRERQVKYDVIIPDIQQAIDQENPLPSPEELEELEGRKARYAWWKEVKLRRNLYLRPRAPLHYPVASVHGDGKGLWQYKGEVLRISKGDPNVPAIWIDGGIHAREWISPASVTYIINYLVENSDELQADYYILPVVNPDGYEYTFRGDRLWRKNRSSPEKGGVCIGVDLNRNFGYRWGGLGTSKQPCREIFAGTGPFSEPETAAMKNFFEASAANFKAYLSFHSYGQYILYPWGYDRRVPPDYADLERVGQKSASAMKAAGGSGSIYTVGNSATTLYAAAGGSDDWAKAILKIKYAYTIELRDKGKSGFILPARYIIPTAKEALAAVLTITEASKSV